MPDESAPTDPALPAGLPPDEMFARAMQSVRMTHSGGAHGWEPPSIGETARLFPSYEVLRLLGRGGIGAVYQARQMALDRLVAIKLLPLEISVDAAFADRFRREARAMAKLNHPNIIAVYDFGQTAEGHLFIAMEYVEGANLHDIIHQVGLDPAQALSIVEQVCAALGYAHGKGIVHRDIKPANVMVNSESHVKVADFGLARLLDAGTADLGHTVTGTVMGTPDYMAPEQMQGMNVDHRADIYSLGVMIYEMLCREVPKGAFQTPSARTGCDARIDEIVIKAMQQAPDHRYQSTTEMKADVTAARGPLLAEKPGEPIKPQGAPLPKPPPVIATPRLPVPPPAAKTRASFSVGIVAGVAVLAVLAWLVWPKPEQLTKAQLVMAQRAAAKSAAPATPAPPAALVAETKVPAAPASPEPEPAAIKLWDSSEKVLHGGKWEDNALRLDGAVFYNKLVSRDAIIRASIRMNPDAESPQIALRKSETSEDRYYALIINAKAGGIYLGWHVDSHYPVLKAWPLPRAYGADEWARLELRAVGDALTASLDGQVLGTIHDSSITEPGGVMLYAGANGYFRDIEYVPLDGAAAASKDAPFVNTLGMKFVPVPGTKVLFSIWDTRVQDYVTYARVNTVDGGWSGQHRDGVPASREPEYPVVGVSWDDAQAFCRWLTDKERAAGKLPMGAKSRLPTDEEWSHAVGLAPEQGATPAEKDGRNGVDSPWGTGYPPTAKVGNYADTAFHAKFPLNENGKGAWGRNEWMEGYTDGYATTSPVGSFPANAFGLYDMGGNVWQWCEDWYDASKKDRVVRGASWSYFDRAVLLSANRNQNAPTFRRYDYGFRCVLEPAPSPAPAVPK